MYVKEQIDRLGTNNSNIAGLQCKTKKSTNESSVSITYNESEFDKISKVVKRLTGTKADVSLLRVFKSNNPYYIYYDKYMIYNTYFIKDNFKAELNTHGLNHKSLFNSVISTVTTVDKTRLLSELGVLNVDFNSIVEHCKLGATVCCINFVNDNRRYHAVATIFWYEGGTLHCGIYDPIYYIREKDNYIWAVNTITWSLMLLGNVNDVNVNIQNFSELCYTTEKGVRCVQYIIDAEYCQMYCLYFIYLYSRAGFPETKDGIQAVINDTYISDFRELKRNPCKATNSFRLTFMAFVLSVLLCFSDENDVSYAVNTLYNVVKNDGYELLTPEIRGLIKTDTTPNSELVSSFLASHPNYVGISNAYDLSVVPERVYTVLYQRKGVNESPQSYTGRLMNKNMQLAFLDKLGVTGKPKHFDKNEILGVFHPRIRGGRSRRCRRRTICRKSRRRIFAKS